MKVAAAALVLALAGALLYWFLLRAEPIPAAGTTSPLAAGSSSSAPSPGPTTTTKKKVVDKVRRITKEERTELASQIQQAKSRRDNLEARDGKKPADPLPTLADGDATLVKTTMKTAMQELIPMLSDCYDRGGSALPKMMDVVADLQLTGDPDIGTIVDANSLVNKDGSPIDPTFEACVRDTLVTLEMPPLSEGGAVKVTYPFAFARDDSTMPQ